jgi:putative tryptophan/tyrosine transport system substrate-binding protein
VTALSRRQVVQGAGAVGLGLLVGCGRWPGQAPPAPLPRIGLLAAARDTSPTVRQALEDVGYVHGHNMILEARTAEGRLDRLTALATELVQLPVDVIVTSGTPATLAAKDATSTIPIVQAVGAADLVREGVVVSLARPGGNVTGLTEIVPELTAKRLQLLQEMVPGLSRVAVLGQLGSPNAQQQMGEMQSAAQSLGMQLQSLLVSGPNELESVLDAALREQAEALILVTDPITVLHQTRIATLATASRLPSMFDRRDYAAAGGLISYGPDTARMHQRAATYVDRILKGTKPADLPIERPTTFDFIINAKTAQTLGLTIPPHVLYQATEVIQ